MRRLLKTSERSGNEWFAYHSSPVENLESIKRDGLKANSEYMGSLNLSLGGTFDGAEEWGYLKANPNGFVVVKVSLKAEDIENIKLSTSEWKEFYESKMLQEFRNLGYEVETITSGEETVEEFIESVTEDENDEELYRELEDKVLAEFFNNYELNMTYDIPASQIVAISDVIS